MLRCSLGRRYTCESALGGPCLTGTTFPLPTSFWSLTRRRLEGCRVPAAHPFPPPRGSSCASDERVMLRQILLLKKLPFLVAQWHSFQELFTRSPLCFVNQWTAASFECGLPALVLLATPAISLCWMCLECDGVRSQAGQVLSCRCCKAFLTLSLYFPKLIRCKTETCAFKYWL